MKRLLLDTHVWLWSALEPDKLSVEVRNELDDPANELWLSTISVWEVLLLFARGRVVTKEQPEVWARNALTHSRLQEAPLTHEIVLQTRHSTLAHKDSADRFLVATALVLGLTLVTADRRLLDCEQIPVLRAD